MIKNKKPHVYKTGDYVMIKNISTTPGTNKKLLPKYKGPYIVNKVLDLDRYLIGDIEGFQLNQKPFSGIVGPDRMKPWIKHISFECDPNDNKYGRDDHNVRMTEL